MATLLSALHYSIQPTSQPKNSVPGEKQEKQNKSKASERKKYVKIVHLDLTDYRNNDNNKGTAQSLDWKDIEEKKKGVV